MNDITGNGYNKSVVETPGWQGGVGTTYDGIGQYESCGIIPNFSQLSFAMQVEIVTPLATGALWGVKSGESLSLHSRYFNGYQQISLRYAESVAWFPILDGPLTGQHHIAVTVINGIVRLFLDGSLYLPDGYSWDYPWTPITGIANPMFWGCRNVDGVAGGFKSHVMKKFVMYPAFISAGDIGILASDMS